MYQLPDHPDIQKAERYGAAEGERCGECAVCGEDYFEGDVVFKIDGEAWCHSCIKDCAVYAEKEGY